MLEEILGNVEKELSSKLTQDEKVLATDLIKRGFDSRSIAIHIKFMSRVAEYKENYYDRCKA